MTGFRWNDWNLEQATKHGCRVEEIERAVRRELSRGNAHARADGSILLIGSGVGGRPLEIAFHYDLPDASALHDVTVYVIHAMPLTTRRRRSR
ncbi:MAG TPA: hypothetical protein VG269_28000 [Tepidisphaeraceae bacterium]|jgi:hypothetical protein|nr:hypothetical protein [Tepidisphaeraceae bacterium]